MNSSNNLKSGQKSLFLQLFILTVVIILVAFIGLLIQKSSTGTIFNTGFKSYQTSAKLLKDLSAVHSNLYRIKGMVASGQDKQEIARISDQQIALMTEDINLVKKTLDTGISSEQQEFYKGILANLTEYEKAAVQVIRLAPMNTGSAYLSSANDKMEATTQLLNQLLELESTAAQSAYGTASVVFYIVLVALVALLVVSFILIPSFIKKMLTGSVIEPLQETSGVLREYASGRYNRSLTWEADDAIGEVVESLNALRSKLSAAGAPSKAAASETAPAQKAAAPEPAAARSDDKAKSLSDMIKKGPEQAKDADKLVISSKKAIDKLQDI
ncbi:MAG: hypothetical protein K4445_01265 [Deltaproteobacteria bacterium]|jgi:methyl-accepting chemotaxis protein|nr:hypothetical protein [Syntrophaceae bacterium]